MKTPLARRNPLRARRDEFAPNLETVPAPPSPVPKFERLVRIALVVVGAFAAGFCARSLARLVDASPTTATAVLRAPITPFVALPFVHAAILP